MARTVALSTLRTRIRRATDQERSQFVSDAELNDEINSGLAELWSIMTEADPDWNIVRTTLTTTAGTEEYTAPDIPASMAFLRAVFVQVGSNRWIPVKSYNVREGDLVERYGEDPYLPPPGGTRRARYRFYRNRIDGGGATLSFRPDPGNNTYRLEYIPGTPTLVNDADEMDGVNGWEDYIIERVSVYVRGKADEESAAARAEGRRAKLEKRIRFEAGQRDQGDPPQPARIMHRRYY